MCKALFAGNPKITLGKLAPWHQKLVEVRAILEKKMTKWYDDIQEPLERFCEGWDIFANDFEDWENYPKRMKEGKEGIPSPSPEGAPDSESNPREAGGRVPSRGVRQYRGNESSAGHLEQSLSRPNTAYLPSSSGSNNTRAKKKQKTKKGDNDGSN